jgi:hypothetical protein
MLHKYDSKIFGARLGVVVVRWKYWWVLMVWVGEIDFIIIFYMMGIIFEFIYQIFLHLTGLYYPVICPSHSLFIIALPYLPLPMCVHKVPNESPPPFKERPPKRPVPLTMGKEEPDLSESCASTVW